MKSTNPASQRLKSPENKKTRAEIFLEPRTPGHSVSTVLKYFEDKKILADLTVIYGSLEKPRTWINLAEYEAEAFRQGYDPEWLAANWQPVLSDTTGTV